MYKNINSLLYELNTLNYTEEMFEENKKIEIAPGYAGYTSKISLIESNSQQLINLSDNLI